MKVEMHQPTFQQYQQNKMLLDHFINSLLLQICSTNGILHPHSHNHKRYPRNHLLPTTTPSAKHLH